MTKIVIDTNVLVSAAMSPNGTTAKVAKLVADTESLQVYYSKMIMNEYERVLAYGHLRINLGVQQTMISDLQEFGILINPPTSSIPMPDETDRVFYDTAKASGRCLLTTLQVQVLSAATFENQGS